MSLPKPSTVEVLTFDQRPTAQLLLCDVAPHTSAETLQACFERFGPRTSAIDDAMRS